MNQEFSAAWRARDHVAARLADLTFEDLTAISRQMSKRVTGVLASQKNGRPIPWRNRDERDLMRLLEADPEVAAYEAMPGKVEFTLDGKRHRHLPAVRVISGGRPTVMDVFARRGAQSGVRSKLADVLTDIYAKEGIRYAAVDPASVRLEPRFGNALYVLEHRLHRISDDQRFRVMEALTSCGGSATVAALRSRLGADVGAVFTMAAQQQVKLDLSAREPSLICVSMRPRGLSS